VGRDSWWQNNSWNEETEAAFFRKLARARNKSFYLKNQAGFLASNHPAAALRLLDQYFALGGDATEAEAHLFRARAHIALRNVDAAVHSFEAALARENAHPNYRTQAFLELPVLIATERRSALYDRAIDILTERKSAVILLIERYKWLGALALILHEKGQTLEAQSAARQALEAAKATDSGFRYHPEFGLVDGTTDEFGTRLRKIADKPRARFQWWPKRML
jgi:tetratricopeptide (TPR) repeat protein